MSPIQPGGADAMCSFAASNREARAEATEQQSAAFGVSRQGGLRVDCGFLWIRDSNSVETCRVLRVCAGLDHVQPEFQLSENCSTLNDAAV